MPAALPQYDVRGPPAGSCCRPSGSVRTSLLQVFVGWDRPIHRSSLCVEHLEHDRAHTQDQAILVLPDIQFEVSNDVR